jgi:hypothetical protein
VFCTEPQRRTLSAGRQSNSLLDRSACKLSPRSESHKSKISNAHNWYTRKFQFIPKSNSSKLTRQRILTVSNKVHTEFLPLAVTKHRIILPVSKQESRTWGPVKPGLYTTTPEQLPRRPFFPGLVNCIQVRNELLLAPNRQGESYIPAAAVERGKAGGRSRSTGASGREAERHGKGMPWKKLQGPFLSAFMV